jgi:uncharacterized membrane protein YcaP (DUF421 family)
MFDLNVSGLEIVARTAIVYFVLLGMLRLAGKRQIGQITPFDLVLILLISNAVQNAMVGPDVSVTGGLIAAAVLILGNYLVAEARTHFPWLRFAVEGTPTLLIQDGQILDDHLHREGIDVDDVMRALREHGFASPEDVQTAVLEVDGSISFSPMGTNVIRTRKHPKLARKTEA